MFLIIDFLNVAYRSFHAIRELTNSKGVPTNATFGFLNATRRWIGDFKPTHLAIVMDAETPQRRLSILPSYKENRPPTPEKLPPQLATLTGLFPLLGWPVIAHPDEEADDLGAALAVKAAAEGHEVRIASNDKDFFQVVGPRIKVVRGSAKETVLADDTWLRENWGVGPEQIVDYLALRGDTSDNIPGVPGVGEKTAVELLKKYGSLDAIVASLPKMPASRVRESLSASTGILARNRQLIRLSLDLSVPPVDDFRLKAPRLEPLLNALSELEFKSLAAQYQKQTAQPSRPEQAELF